MEEKKTQGKTEAPELPEEMLAALQAMKENLEETEGFLRDMRPAIAEAVEAAEVAEQNDSRFTKLLKTLTKQEIRNYAAFLKSYEKQEDFEEELRHARVTERSGGNAAPLYDEIEQKAGASFFVFVSHDREIHKPVKIRLEEYDQKGDGHKIPYHLPISPRSAFLVSDSIENIDIFKGALRPLDYVQRVASADGRTQGELKKGLYELNEKKAEAEKAGMADGKYYAGEDPLDAADFIDRYMNKEGTLKINSRLFGLFMWSVFEFFCNGDRDRKRQIYEDFDPHVGPLYAFTISEIYNAIYGTPYGMKESVSIELTREIYAMSRVLDVDGNAYCSVTSVTDGLFMVHFPSIHNFLRIFVDKSISEQILAKIEERTEKLEMPAGAITMTEPATNLSGPRKYARRLAQLMAVQLRAAGERNKDPGDNRIHVKRTIKNLLQEDAQVWDYITNGKKPISTQLTRAFEGFSECLESDLAEHTVERYRNLTLIWPDEVKKKKSRNGGTDYAPGPKQLELVLEITHEGLLDPNEEPGELRVVSRSELRGLRRAPERQRDQKTQEKGKTTKKAAGKASGKSSGKTSGKAAKKATT